MHVTLKQLFGHAVQPQQPVPQPHNTHTPTLPTGVQHHVSGCSWYWCEFMNTHKISDGPVSDFLAHGIVFIIPDPHYIVQPRTHTSLERLGVCRKNNLLQHLSFAFNSTKCSAG